MATQAQEHEVAAARHDEEATDARQHGFLAAARAHEEAAEAHREAEEAAEHAADATAFGCGGWAWERADNASADAWSASEFATEADLASEG